MMILIIFFALAFLLWFYRKKSKRLISHEHIPEKEDAVIKNSEYYIKKYDLLSDLKETEHSLRNEKTDKYIKLPTQKIIEKIEIVKQEDEFEGTTLIYHNHISQKDYNYLPMYFEKITDDLVSIEHVGLSFVIFENQIFLTVYSFVKEMGLAKHDRLVLLFENEKRIEVIFPSTRSSGTVKSNTYQLNPEELSIFIYNDLIKWKLISSRRNVFIVGDNTLFHEYCTIDNQNSSQKILRFLAKSILLEYIKMNQDNTAHNNAYKKLLDH